jgi:hypothetical protein
MAREEQSVFQWRAIQEFPRTLIMTWKVCTNGQICAVIEK